jgi:hypothetical protein
MTRRQAGVTSVNTLGLDRAVARPEPHGVVQSVHEIVLGLFQGANIPSGATFERMGISALVDVEDRPHTVPPVPPWGVYILWPLPDGDTVDPDTTRALARTIRDLINAGHTVLIHCRSGLNRSSLVAARVLISMGWDPEQAVSHVRKCRRDSRALSNETFASWLLAEAPGT